MRLLWILALLGWSLPAQARWLEAESPHFIVYSDGSDANLRGFVQQLEDFDSLLRDLTGMKREPSINKLRIYLVRGPDSLREIAAVSNSIAGFYIAGPRGIAAFAIRRGESEALMLHEYAHHFMIQHFPFGYPAWYVEGFAEYLMTAKFSPTDIEVGRPGAGATSWLRYEDWLPAETLLTKTVEGLDDRKIVMFYAQAWLATHYINRTPGKLTALREYLVALGGGTPAADAFKTAFGTDFADFQRELERYFKTQMTYTVYQRQPTGAQPEITLRPLPASADDLMLSLADLRSGVGDKRDARRLAQIRRAAARYPEDVFAQRVLALGEAWIGDPAVAVAVADKLIAHGAADGETLFAKATALAAQAKDAEAGTGRASLLQQARQTFVLANRASPDQATILFGYAQAQLASAPPNRNTLEVLLRARALAPQVASIGMLTAYAAMHQKDFATAEALLKPIAYNPHGGKAAKAAAAMLEGAREKRVVKPPEDYQDEE